MLRHATFNGRSARFLLFRKFCFILQTLKLKVDGDDEFRQRSHFKMRYVLAKWISKYTSGDSIFIELAIFPEITIEMKFQAKLRMFP